MTTQPVRFTTPTFRAYAKVVAIVLCADLFIWLAGSLLARVVA
jgi:hypothetical protein